MVGRGKIVGWLDGGIVAGCIIPPSYRVTIPHLFSMGRQDIEPDLSPEAARRFTRALLEDLRALEQILERGLIEEGCHRIGAEQEMFLVDKAWRPAPVALEVLDRLRDPRCATELARFAS